MSEDIRPRPSDDELRESGEKFDAEHGSAQSPDTWINLIQRDHGLFKAGKIDECELAFRVGKASAGLVGATYFQQKVFEDNDRLACLALSGTIGTILSVNYSTLLRNAGKQKADQWVDLTIDTMKFCMRQLGEDFDFMFINNGSAERP